MSVLTRAHAIRSKYPTNIGMIRSEQETLRGILKKRDPYLKEGKEKQSAYQKLLGEAEMATKGFRATYGSGSDDSRSLQDIAKSYQTQKTEEFDKQEYAQGFLSVKRMLDAGTSEHDVKGITLWGGAADTWHAYQRGKQPFSELESDLGQLQDTWKSFGSYESNLTTAKADLEKHYSETKSYQDEIDASVKKLRGYGASEQEIDTLIGSPGQRKRGTRQSAQRRTMLTSRSAFA